MGVLQQNKLALDAENVEVDPIAAAYHSGRQVPLVGAICLRIDLPMVAFSVLHKICIVKGSNPKLLLGLDFRKRYRTSLSWGQNNRDYV